MSFENPFAQATSPQEAQSEKPKYEATLEQVTTRGDGNLELKEVFNKYDVDFAGVLDHLKIHQEGAVAGSQFNGELFQSGRDIARTVRDLLPDEIHYDQFNRAEITLTVTTPNGEPFGWSGVKSLEEIQNLFPEASIERQVRIPGGEEAVEGEIEGSWYPETTRDPETGRFVPVLNEERQVKNPHGKFEPKANMITVTPEEFSKLSATNKVTIIFQQDRTTQKPVALTIFPGENAPSFPTKIESDDFKVDTLQGGNEAKYWQDHAFVKQQAS